MASERFALAVDIGGTKVDAALFTAEGDLVRESVARRPTGREATRAGIAESIRSAAVAALGGLERDRLLGVGVGSAGPVDGPSIAIAPLNLPQAHGLRIDEVLAGDLPGVPVTLALDGTCIAAAEHWRGALRGAANAMALVVSTGVGGGIIADGRAVGGRTGNAGHIGQIHVRARDEADPLAGTVEAIAAGPGSVRWAREQGWTGSTGEELAAAYRAGSEIADRTIERSARALGEGIAAATTLLDLEAVSIAGGFSFVADDYVERVERHARAAAMHPYGREVRVVRSALGGDGPLLGAASLVLRPA
jgi:glucokinase